eukprot:TRINITY_DN29082_c0_g1_i2.p1 TRINITY_DN29082_c0_g1~~TRINITY_DN29082_c0_g1_i2.p1  ORF type:complete len:372 (-),score=86.25 TRINITY_DN29082_c0_g1_i2:327-1442(-)
MLRRLLDEVAKWFPWSPTMRVDLLGVAYDGADPDARERFLEDFRSRVQLTYRSGMSTPLTLVDGKTIDTDTGWGCMLRVTQMMLAQSFIEYLLGRDWRYDAARDLTPGSKYLQIVSCFLDDPSAPLSLHRLVDAGQRLLGKAPSAWFGPTSAARAAGALLDDAAAAAAAEVGEEAERSQPRFLSEIACVVFEDGPICKSVVFDRFARGAKACIVLVCLRLGLDGFNVTEYGAGLRLCFRMPEFQGLASGNSGSSAHFFVATHDDDTLLFLDPHQTLPALESLLTLEGAVDASTDAAAAAGLRAVRPLPLRSARLNPSVCLGFLVRSRDAFESLCDRLSSGEPSKVFEVLERPICFADRGEEALDDDMVLLD